MEDGYEARKRNTSAFTFLAWSSFALALLGMFIGIINLDQLLSVKGYYAVTALFLTMSSFVLQKTVRDNNDDDVLYPVQHMQSSSNLTDSKIEDL
ncbi:YiaA/YiaB family inner membrane protein [Paenibacillus pectinilyticus]|uniref:YiaA/YiaB family inner membrane protein n=1 Tax=Paenibacillus pectinilyticus TaxID=512399 RepID=UPI0024466692|nr:YiaA/YiaB family inner membrane protein [Paenibacillus pectinilyticus]